MLRPAVSPPREVRVTVVSRIFSPEPGAASLRLGALVDALDSAGAAVTVLTSTPPRGLGGDAQLAPGVTVKRRPVLRDRQGYVRGYLQYLSFDVPVAFRLLFSRRPDLVVVEPPPTTGAVVRVVCGIRRIPYAYYAADIWSDAVASTETAGFVQRAVRRFERWAIRGARLVLSVSPELTARLYELCAESNVVTIGNGVDLRRFVPRDGPLTDPPTFVYAGTASEVHGATIFLDAFARVIERGTNARLLFVGQGSDWHELARRAALLPDGAVVLESRIPPEEVATVLRGAVASLASVKPGGYVRAFPTKMYASVAVGTPVIFTGEGPGATFAADPLLGRVADYTVSAVADALRAELTSPADTARRYRIADWAAAHVSLQAVASRATACILSIVPGAPVLPEDEANTATREAP